jgi:hypothetical protein
MTPKGHCNICGIVAYYQCPTCKSGFCSRHLARHRCSKKEAEDGKKTADS